MHGNINMRFSCSGLAWCV